jgi:hypothetical protein
MTLRHVSEYMAEIVNAPTSRACARESADVLERRALAMLDDDQAFASFFRWRTALHGESAAPSLCEKLSVQAYVDAIFQKVPE